MRSKPEHTKRALLATILLVVGLQAEAATRFLDGIAAVVDEDVVLKSELAERMDIIKQQIQSQNTPLPDADALEDQVLERLILESLQLQIAVRAGVLINDEELNITMHSVAEQNGMDLTQFQQALEKDGVSYAKTREQIRKELMMNKVQQGVINSRIEISDQEIDSFLESELGEVVTADQFRVAHILLAVDDDATREEVAEVKRKAETLIEQVRQGADFRQLAVTHSAGQNALEGGDLGWRKTVQLPSLFADRVESMEAGETYGPIKSGSGYHLIHLLAKRGAEAEGNVAQTRVRHILIAPSEIRTPSEAEELANFIREEFQKGRDFAELAKLYSDDPGSALSGGDLGWNRLGTFTPELEDTMIKLEVDEVSEVFRSEFGYHFIQVTGRRTQDFTEEFRKSQAMNYLRNRKFDEELDAWFREIREEAFVEKRIQL